MAGTEIGEPCERKVTEPTRYITAYCRGEIIAAGWGMDAQGHKVSWVGCDRCGWVGERVQPDIPQDTLPGLEL